MLLVLLDMPVTALALLPPVVGLAPGLAVPLLIEAEPVEAPEDADADDCPVDVDAYWLDIAIGE